MKYEVSEGDYLTALHLFHTKGGRFYPQRGEDSPSTIVSGDKCFTVWSPNSRLLPKCKALCREFGFEWEGQSPGRIARQIIGEIIGLNTKGTSYSDSYRRLARKGEHWHYTYVETGYHPYLLEFDLKSAYFTSLFHGRSLNYHDTFGFQDDSGALDNLKALESILPKFMRLVILGILAAHRNQFYIMDKLDEDSINLKLITHSEIKYGSAFNAAHKAIKRTYEAMKRIHLIGGEYIKRIHTDSFALTVDCPNDVEARIFEFLSKNGYPVTVKAQGSAHFLNLNEGLIGNKLIGARQVVFSEFREKNIKIKKYEVDSDEFIRWSKRELIERERVDSMEEERERLKGTATQLVLDLHTRPRV